MKSTFDKNFWNKLEKEANENDISELEDKDTSFCELAKFNDEFVVYLCGTYLNILREEILYAYRTRLQELEKVYFSGEDIPSEKHSEIVFILTEICEGIELIDKGILTEKVWSRLSESLEFKYRRICRYELCMVNILPENIYNFLNNRNKIWVTNFSKIKTKMGYVIRLNVRKENGV